VLINKATIEIPSRFAGKSPVNPAAHKEKSLIAREWIGAQGLAEDVRYYAKWMRDEAEKRIGQLYPEVEVTAEMAQGRPDLQPFVGQKLTVTAWLWARTVKSPNPAFAEVDVPLASTFMLSTKAGKETYVEPVIEDCGYRFTVKVGKGEGAERAKKGTKLSRGANFECLMSGTPIASGHIYGEARAGRLGTRLMAIVAKGERGRIYLAPTQEHEAAALKAKPEWKPDVEMPDNPRWFSPPLYGLTTYGDLFTPRQLVGLTTCSDLVGEAIHRVRRDAIVTNLPDDTTPLRGGGTGATAYAEAVATYLACVTDRMVYYGSSLTSWLPKDNALRDCMPRQALAMVWDFAEGNPFGKSSGDVVTCANAISNYLDVATPSVMATAVQADARGARSGAFVISTDPPYYDNIGYADLSDYFYVWLRRSLRSVFPDLFSTLAVPKAEELVATPYRHGSSEKAEAFFLEGMTDALRSLQKQALPGIPVTVYYAFKQSETKDDVGTASTGWETFLEAVMQSGFAITGTWPIRTEGAGRMIASGTNALASSIILVCRKRLADAPTVTRREFVGALKADLPNAIAHLQRGNIAPVDLAQAAIGPGMAVYSRFSEVLDVEGKRLSVREALTLINQILDETLAEHEGDFDADTRWALTWFEQQGFGEGDFGIAEQLSKSKNISVAGMVEAGILEASRGKVRLLRAEELPSDWDPTTDTRLTTWEMVHHLIRLLAGEGESGAAELIIKLGAKAEVARELAYRLTRSLSERSGRKKP